MARKRMIAPSFFKHADLFDAEVASGLPLRIAFAGLWTVADRRGVFPWSRNVKPDVLPYDGCDMLAVLEALAAGGFVVKYEVDGKWYGLIPTLGRHQHFHKDERPNTMPAPPAGEGSPVPTPSTAPLPAPGKHRASTGQAPGQRAKSTEVNGRHTASDIRLATSQEQEPSLARAAKNPPPADAFDLGPYLSDYADRFPGSTVPAARFGRALKPLERQHGGVETRRRWRVFLPVKGELGPEYFARTWSEWATAPPTALARNGARPSAAEQMSASMGRIFTPAKAEP